MDELALWYRKRLRVLIRGPRVYGAFDTVNAALARQGLIAHTSKIVGSNRREYEITPAGRATYRRACEGDTQDIPEDPTVYGRHSPSREARC